MSVDSSVGFAASKKYKHDSQAASRRGEYPSSYHEYPPSHRHHKGGGGYNQGYHPTQAFQRRKQRPYHFRNVNKKFMYKSKRYGTQEEFECYPWEEYYPQGSQSDTPNYTPQYQGYSLQDSPMASGAPTDHNSPPVSTVPSVRRNDPYAVNVIPEDIEAENIYRQNRLEEARRSYYDAYSSETYEMPLTTDSFAQTAMNPNAAAFQAPGQAGPVADEEEASRSDSLPYSEKTPPTEKSRALSPFQEAFVIQEPSPVDLQAKELELDLSGQTAILPHEQPASDLSCSTEAKETTTGKEKEKNKDKKEAEPSLAGAWVALVTFRSGVPVPFLIQDAKKCFKESRVTRQTAVGVHVIVDGDRGVDLGTMSEVIPVFDRNQTAAALEYNANRGRRLRAPKLLPLVIREASCAEIADFEMLEVEESVALQFAQLQARKEFGNERLTIKAATFQFDRQKLTLTFTAPERIFFVPLLKTLNQRYRCRIWMEHSETEREKEGKSSRKPREHH